MRNNNFLLRDPMLAWYMLLSCVHPSVTSREVIRSWLSI